MLDQPATVAKVCGSCERPMLVPMLALQYFTLPHEYVEALNAKNIARCGDCGDYIHAFCNASLHSDVLRCASCASEHTHKFDGKGALYGLLLVVGVIAAVYIIAALPSSGFGAAR